MTALSIDPMVGRQASYRPDIDGLRAFAVLAVVFYHAFPSALRGGFVGVDIFFVISGFLITSIIINESRHGFSFIGFYVRRIRRIFPALIVVLICTLLAGGCWPLSPDDFTSLTANAAGGALFISNFVSLHQIGYFDVVADKKPLLHLWSLGIEEQFYIFWPLIVVGAFSRGFRLISVILALATVSFALCIVLTRAQPSYAFYLPVTRIWELLAGALLASWSVEYPHIRARLQRKLSALVGTAIFTMPRPDGHSPALVTNISSIVGLLLIVIPLFAFHSHTAFPGWRALLPVVGTMLLIASPDAWLNRHVLSHRVCVLIGLISYPLYLWHFPLLAFLRIYNDSAGRWERGLAVLASIALAWLTYAVIEKPFRFGAWKQHSRLLCAAMAIPAIVSIVVVWNGDLEIRLPSSLRSLVRQELGKETSEQWRRGRCLLLPGQAGDAFATECQGDGKHPLLLVWGDSYASASYPGLARVAQEEGFSVAQYAGSACPPLLGFVHPDRPQCRKTNDTVIRKAAQLRPDIVWLQAVWGYDRGMLDPLLGNTVQELRRLGVKRIILAGPVPRWSGRGLPQNFIDYYHMNDGEVLPERTWFRVEGAELDRQMRAAAEHAGIEYVSPWSVFCDEGGCLTTFRDQQGRATAAAFDPGHLTLPASDYLAENVRKFVFADRQ